MSITIKEALKLDLLKNFKLLAGYGGFSNQIKKVGILDYETHENIEEKFGPGDFVISSLLVFRDNPNGLFYAIESLIEAEVEGLAIKNIYYRDIPNEIKKLADEKGFPIFIFGEEVFFEDIITDIMNAIREKDHNEILLTKINTILSGDLSKAMIRRIAYEINNEFKENIIAAYCKAAPEARNNYQMQVGNQDGQSVIRFRDGILIIYSLDHENNPNMNRIFETHLEGIGVENFCYHVGISGKHRSLDELDICIKESMYACKTAEINHEYMKDFKDIGIYKLLIPLADNPWLLKYHDEMITPMVIYDKKYHTDLLNTAVKYIENNGDIKATAEALFQHGNTIRYRILKIREIIGMVGEDASFYEQLAVAIRIYKMLDIGL